MFEIVISGLLIFYMFLIPLKVCECSGSMDFLKRHLTGIWETATKDFLYKNIFLNISQYSQENNRVGVSF